MKGFYKADCMDIIRQIPDKYFELAIVDPPYGIGQNWKKKQNTDRFDEADYKNDRPPGAEYFQELKRVSVDQIIWGYNYFTEYLGPTNYLIVWDKQANDGLNYSKAEIAYTTKRIPCNIVSITWDGFRMGHETGTKKIHPQQKPIELYKWLLTEYAQPGDKILDTHAGSGSLIIACAQLGFEYLAIEKDPHFYARAKERVKPWTRQKTIWAISNRKEGKRT